jgi:hypothetical protein
MAYSKAKLKCNGNEAHYSHKKNSHCHEEKSKQLSRRYKHCKPFNKTNTVNQILG